MRYSGRKLESRFSPLVPQKFGLPDAGVYRSIGRINL